MITGEQKEKWDGELAEVEKTLKRIAGEMMAADAAETMPARSSISAGKLGVGQARGALGPMVTPESAARAESYLVGSTPAKPTGMRTVSRRGPRKGRRDERDEG